jgi:uncharacterized membrane protein
MRSVDLVSTELVIFELLALLFPLILVAALFFVIRGAMSANGSQTIGESGSSVKETLDRRYASGEITQEEYLTIKDDISREDDA